MHVTSKDSSKDGTLHTLTSVIEADGAYELASPEAELSADVVRVERTASGGIEVEMAVKVAEPAPVEIKAEPPTTWGKLRGKK